jgi:acetyl-CoA carboxylase / biotin carboxylase 1
VHFADLHDTPGRMKAKGVIRKLIQWAESRKFFYWRLRRRLQEFQMFGSLQLTVMDTNKARKEFIAEVQQWAYSLGANQDIWESDEALIEWFDKHSKELKAFLLSKKNAVHAENVSVQLQQLLQSESSTDGLKAALAGLSAEQRALLSKAL